MSVHGTKLLDNDGNPMLPVTRSALVYHKDGSTDRTLETYLTNLPTLALGVAKAQTVAADSAQHLARVQKKLDRMDDWFAGTETLRVTRGGTGLNKVASGQLLYSTAANTWGTIAKSAFVMKTENNTLSGNNTFTGTNTFHYIMPATDNTYMLGYSDQRWQNIYSVTFTGALTGNASTATKLATAKTLWGQSFDGSDNVSGALTGVTDLTASGDIAAQSVRIANGQALKWLSSNSQVLSMMSFSSSNALTVGHASYPTTIPSLLTVSKKLTVSSGGMAVTGDTDVVGSIAATAGVAAGGITSLASGVYRREFAVGEADGTMTITHNLNTTNPAVIFWHSASSSSSQIDVMSTLVGTSLYMRYTIVDANSISVTFSGCNLFKVKLIIL